MNQPLIAQKLLPRQLSYTPTALLRGKAGVGKTTLANKLSGISDGVNVEESKMQRAKGVYSVIYDRNAFVLLDIPETGADPQEIDTKMKISTIFFVIKYDGRFERMINVYFELEVSVVNDADRIVVMISHWDQSKTPEEDFKEIRDLFAEECPHRANIIFYSEQYVDAELAKLMYSCISNMEEVELADCVIEGEIENSMNRSYEHCQGSENGTVNKCSDSIFSETFKSGEDDAHLMITDDSDHNTEEPRVKDNLKRAFDKCQSDSDSDSLPTLRKENVPQSTPFDSFEYKNYTGKSKEYVERENRKKMKSESNILTRWRDYCCIL